MTIIVIILLLFSSDFYKIHKSVYAVGEGCSESHEFNDETSILLNPPLQKKQIFITMWLSMAVNE